MSDFVVGIPLGMVIGIAMGLSLGIIIGKKQKPWSELTEEEKRQRKFLIGAGLIVLVIGFFSGVWQYFSF